MTSLSDESAWTICDACEGHGHWVEGSNPGRIKTCEVCNGLRFAHEPGRCADCGDGINVPRGTGTSVPCPFNCAEDMG